MCAEEYCENKHKLGVSDFVESLNVQRFVTLWRDSLPI